MPFALDGAACAGLAFTADAFPFCAGVAFVSDAAAASTLVVLAADASPVCAVAAFTADASSASVGAAFVTDASSSASATSAAVGVAFMADASSACAGAAFVSDAAAASTLAALAADASVTWALALVALAALAENVAAGVSTGAAATADIAGGVVSARPTLGASVTGASNKIVRTPFSSCPIRYSPAETGFSPDVYVSTLGGAATAPDTGAVSGAFRTFCASFRSAALTVSSLTKEGRNCPAFTLEIGFTVFHPLLFLSAFGARRTANPAKQHALIFYRQRRRKNKAFLKNYSYR